MTTRTERIAARLIAAELAEIDRALLENCNKRLFPPLLRTAQAELKKGGAAVSRFPTLAKEPPAKAELHFSLDGENFVFVLEYDLGWGRPNCYFNRPNRPPRDGFGGGHDIPRAIREFLREHSGRTAAASPKRAESRADRVARRLVADAWDDLERKFRDGDRETLLNDLKLEVSEATRGIKGAGAKPGKPYPAVRPYVGYYLPFEYKGEPFHFYISFAKGGKPKGHIYWDADGSHALDWRGTKKFDAAFFKAFFKSLAI